MDVFIPIAVGLAIGLIIQGYEKFSSLISPGGTKVAEKIN